MYHNSNHEARSCPLRLLLMSKNARPFSRLSAVLGTEQRALLQQLLLIRQICLCALYLHRHGQGVGSGAQSLVLWSAPVCEQGTLATEAVEFFGVAQFVQREGHLGERMHQALASPCGKLRVENQFLLGIDSVGLTISQLHRCIGALARKPWVFIPAADGGFVACAVSLSVHDGYAPTSPTVAFAQSRWSHAGVLADVLARLDPREYECTDTAGDIDTAEDLAQARADGSLALALDVAVRCLTAARAGIAPADFLNSLVLEERSETDVEAVEQRLQVSCSKLGNDPRLTALYELLHDDCNPKTNRASTPRPQP